MKLASETISKELTVAKIRLRLSNDSSGINAEMNQHIPPQFQPLKWRKKKKANNNSHHESKINNAMADMQRGMTARSATMKWDVPRTTLQSRKKAGFKSVTRPVPPQSLYIGWGKNPLQLAYWAKSQEHTSTEKSFAVLYSANINSRTPPYAVREQPSGKRMVPCLFTTAP